MTKAIANQLRKKTTAAGRAKKFKGDSHPHQRAQTIMAARNHVQRNPFCDFCAFDQQLLVVGATVIFNWLLATASRFC